MEEGYYNTKESAEEYIRLAKDVNGADLIKEFKKHLSPQAELLELGSGPGSDWQILSEDFQVVGSDNSKEFLRHLSATDPTGKFLELDAISLEVEQKFDGIYTNKVLHHLTDDELKESIKRQHEVLRAQGLVCHSFWKGKGSETFKGLYVNYHTEEELSLMFGAYFEPLLIKCYAEFEADDSILFIGKKNQ